MRAYLPNYELVTPKDLSEALAWLSQEREKLVPFAGGTDLMVQLEAGRLGPGRFLNLWNLDHLRGIEVTSDAIVLGALTTYAQVQRHAAVQSELPLLARAASQTGALAIQSRGTLGGNLVNASPAADSPPALLVYDALVELVSLRGSRWLPYREFHLGYRQTARAADELLTRVRVPRRERGLHFYRKVGPRRALAISKVSFAATGRVEGGVLGDVAIALGSVAPVPLRAVATEAELRGRSLAGARARALDALGREVTPIDDVRSTAAFRRRVSQNLLADFLDELGLVR